MTATLSEAPLAVIAGRTRRTAAAAVQARTDQHVLVQEPCSGTVVRMSVGRQLVLRFRPRVGASRWRVAERPDHLVALAGGGNELCFLVFDGGHGAGAGRLRLERADSSGRVHETRELVVLPVS